MYPADMYPADLLQLPERTAGVLWDMDGVLVDTLAQDSAIVDEILQESFPGAPSVPFNSIKRYFPLDLRTFWSSVLSEVDIKVSQTGLDRLEARHHEFRESRPAPLHRGVGRILAAIRDSGIRQAVVSNNPDRDIRGVLEQVELLPMFDALVSNDVPGLRKKPHPDPYLEGARRLGVSPDSCLAVEDSLIGVEASAGAGCYTVGVATGAASFRQLSESSFTNRTYSSFTAADLVVATKDDGPEGEIPDPFVAELVRALLAPSRLTVRGYWPNDNWEELGVTLGRGLRTHTQIRPQAESWRQSFPESARTHDMRPIDSQVADQLWGGLLRGFELDSLKMSFPLVGGQQP
jgi:HAD superfamily hydrolase (TIGR01509 family)